MPCLACAGSVEPRTPFVPLDALFLAFASHRADLSRELKLARAVFAGSERAAEQAARFLPEEAGAPVPARAADAAALVAHYERAIAIGAPAAPADVDAWYTSRMRAFAEENWDRGLDRAAENEPS
jgi:hypothetical protein